MLDECGFLLLCLILGHRLEWNIWYLNFFSQVRCLNYLRLFLLNRLYFLLLNYFYLLGNRFGLNFFFYLLFLLFNHFISRNFLLNTLSYNLDVLLRQIALLTKYLRSLLNFIDQ